MQSFPQNKNKIKIKSIVYEMCEGKKKKSKIFSKKYYLQNLNNDCKIHKIISFKTFL